jgi:hypothetical protein
LQRQCLKISGGAQGDTITMTTADSAVGGQQKRTMSAEPVDRPPHPVHAMATFELTGYRRQLESAIAFFSAQNPVPPARDQLQAKLDVVLAEQDEREKIAGRG